MAYTDKTVHKEIVSSLLKKIRFEPAEKKHCVLLVVFIVSFLFWETNATQAF